MISASRPSGVSRQLQCKYHGWSYTLEGQLRAAHEMQEAKDFDIACIHLDPISTGVWQGLIFAAVQQPPVPLENLLAGITERIAPIELGQMEFHSRKSAVASARQNASRSQDRVPLLPSASVHRLSMLN